MYTNTSSSGKNNYDEFCESYPTSKLHRHTGPGPLEDVDLKRYTTSSLTVPPEAYKVRKPIPDFYEVPLPGFSIHHEEAGYGPGTMEYELAADYLRQSMRVRSININRSTTCSQYQARSINSYQSTSAPPILVAPPTHFDSYSPRIQCLETGKKGKERETHNEHTLSKFYSTSGQQQLLSRSIPIEDINIEPQRYIISKGTYFFLFGFLLMPLWWFGSRYPRVPNSKIEYRWKCYNRMMSFVSVVILCSVFAFAVWALS